jgi:integrase/recombinase XerC
MREEWVEDPVRGYEENARHLLGYPASTVREYVRDLRQFEAWVTAGDNPDAPVGEPAGGRPNPAAGAEARPVANSSAINSVHTTKSPIGAATQTRAYPQHPPSPAPVGPVEVSEAFERARTAELEPHRSAGRLGSDDRSSPPAVGRGVRLLAVTREEVEGWVVRLSDRGLRATTINRKLASLNSFYVWAAHHRLVERSPAAGIRKLKIPRRLPKFLTFDDVRVLLGYTGSPRRTATVRGKQVHAMISILYHLGLRRQELVDLRFEHIEKVSDREVFLHVFGKGDKQRLVPFVEPAFAACQHYLRFRPESPAPQVFVSLHTGRPLSLYDVNNVCRRLSRRLKLSKPLTPHVLRHTFATHLHLRGQPIEHINALLGHESLNTTKIYYAQPVDMCSAVA